MSGRHGRSLSVHGGRARYARVWLRRALCRRIVLWSKGRAKARAAPCDGVHAESDDLGVRRTERTHVVDDSLERANRLLDRNDPTPGSNLVSLGHCLSPSSDETPGWTHLRRNAPTAGDFAQCRRGTTEEARATAAKHVFRASKSGHVHGGRNRASQLTR